MSQQINLFNPQFVARKAYFSSASMLKGWALVFAGCALYTAHLYYQVHGLTKVASEVQVQLATSSVQLTQVKTQHATSRKSHELEVQLQQTEQEVLALRQVMEVLSKGNIGNTEGYSSYMRALARQSMEGVWLTGFNIVGGGDKIELAGKAIKPELLPVYINRLKSEAILQGKTFGTLEMATPGTATEAGAKTAGIDNSGQGQVPVEFRLN